MRLPAAIIILCISSIHHKSFHTYILVAKEPSSWFLQYALFLIYAFMDYIIKVKDITNWRKQ
ncbi:MAG: hypothetical protein HPY66_0385 [Firmicutes bacterium]|nr:hypothetical protein [Bacillota bacterium]